MPRIPAEWLSITCSELLEDRARPFNDRLDVAVADLVFHRMIEGNLFLLVVHDGKSRILVELESFTVFGNRQGDAGDIVMLSELYYFILCRIRKVDNGSEFLVLVLGDDFIELLD